MGRVPLQTRELPLMGRTAVVVAVLTYRRPDSLRSGLTELLDQVVTFNEAGAGSADAEVLIVDNDAEASARAVVSGLGSTAVRYVVEPTPGISAARNRALLEAADADLLVFIDDDETPRPGWLDTLVATWQQTRPAAVMGPVCFPIPDHVDPWIAAGGFFDRRRLPTGTSIPVAAAGNLLLDVAQVRTLGVTFDPRLGLSGGEDTLFTKQLVKRGGRIIWCDEAIADHEISAQRATREWVLKRAWRSGNSTTIANLYLASTARERAAARGHALVQGLTRLVSGTLRSWYGALTRSVSHHSNGQRTAQRGRGMLAGIRGLTYEEYARPA